MTDDPFGKDEERDAEAYDFERHGRAIAELLQDYLNEQDIPDRAASVLVLDVAVNMRMVGYATEVEKPSGNGLKLELDRFRREFEDAVRHAKRGADEFIRTVKPVLDAVLSESEDEDDDDEEEEGGEP